MVHQLPVGAEGAAALALIYASVSWTCSSLLLWLTWVHQEGWSYIAMVSAFAILSTTASITQQIHDIIFYRDVITEQFMRKTTFLENPELAIANGSFGLDLVLYYIQYYSYSVQAMLVMFWAGELAQSVYGLGANSRMRRIWRNVNTGGKAVAVVLPLITILLLRIPAIQHVFVAFILIADLPLMISLAIGSSTMIAISCRYVQSRKSFTRWTPPQNSDSALSEEMGTMRSGNLQSSTVISGTSHSGTTTTTGRKRPRKRPNGLYDRWLMVRFTIAFVMLAIFEVTNTLFQLQSVNNNKKDTQLAEPDLTVDRAKVTFFLFLPGTTAGIALFIIFGTTAGCRKSMQETFIPKKWRTRTSKSKSGRSFWRPGRKDSAFPPQTQEPDLSNEDAISDITRRSHYIKSEHMKPLPLPPLSRHNKDFGSRNRVERPYMGNMRTELGEDPGIQLRDMQSWDSIREEYYEPFPDQSDDSGPILPIMRTERRA
ncbi:uncharacterized protein BCR38DRAFT_352843 [Pseudomassariella vexata]|uniref:Glycoside hydrolase n=1 Tax=Pseudomassariella vexata TaxID=1141098 RepID=A0A1Y2DI46_9PEZI|nr:uncharacterized protein BCR38DRAFT_352843 [Pseudomassariella vexata]ORY58485.1 hypothetical protein BCR38DRAFT_352843 [Pseudomassariella vexata]